MHLARSGDRFAQSPTCEEESMKIRTTVMALSGALSLLA